MATSADKSHSTMWARFHSESPNRVVKLLRKSKSMDTLLETTNWTLKDIPDYDTVGTLLPTSLPTVPLSKWEALLNQHGEDIFLHPKRNSTTSKSCPSLLCRPESATGFIVHSVFQSRNEGIPSITIQTEDVSGAEMNQFAAELDGLTLQSARCTDDGSKMPAEVNQKDAFLSWALERAEKSNIKDRAFEEFEVEEKEGLILENDYLSPTVNVHKLVNQRTKAGAEVMEETMAGKNVVLPEYFDTKSEFARFKILRFPVWKIRWSLRPWPRSEHKEAVPGVDTKHDAIQVNQAYQLMEIAAKPEHLEQVDQAYQLMEIAAKPEHLEQIGSIESFEYSFTKTKRKSYCAEEEMKLVVKDKAEIDYKNKQTKFALEHYQGLDVDVKYSEELFDEIDDDDDSADLETQTILCLPFLCRKRRNKHKEEKEPNTFKRVTQKRRSEACSTQ